MEALLHSFKGIGTLRSRGTIESGTHEARRRRGIARQTKETAVASHREEFLRAQHLVGRIAREEVDVVVEIGEMPLEAWCVGYHANLVFIEMGHAVYYLQYYLTAAGIAYAPMDNGNLVEAYDTHLARLDGFHHFVDRGKLTEHPLIEL